MTVLTANADALAPHLPEAAQAAEHQAFGFWLYVMSDMVLFAALFATYAVLSGNTAGGPTGRELFDLPHVFAETLLLLFSSAACGMAMLAVHGRRPAAASCWLALTFLLGVGFIIMEGREFLQFIDAGFGPARSAFLSSFFTLVGTHGVHVACGLIWIAVMLAQVAVKGLTPAVQSRLLRFSIFWHFLDVVWIGVFSLVYLMGVV